MVEGLKNIAKEYFLDLFQQKDGDRDRFMQFQQISQPRKMNLLKFGDLTQPYKTDL